MLTAAVCLTAAPFFNSCSEDMTVNSIPHDNSGIAGTYRLSSFGINVEDGVTPGTYIPTTADLNGDMVESQNLVAESACYGEGYIRLNANHTYGRYYTYFDGTDCVDALREAGVWTREGDVVTLSSSLTNGDPTNPQGMSMDTYTMDLTYSEGGGTLTGSREQIDYMVGTNFGNGKVDFIYTKE